MKEYLELFGAPLGIIVQFLRPNVPSKFLLPGTALVCVLGVWLSAPDGASFKSVIRVGAIWALGTIAGMFGTAYTAYAIAAKGRNPEERKAIAQSPLVPVTDPNKEIRK